MIFLVLAYIKYKRALTQALLNNPGVQKLLRDLSEPIITTHAETAEKLQTHNSNKIPDSAQTAAYDAVFGWAFSQTELLLAADALHLPKEQLHTLGGNKTLQEDKTTITKQHGSVLLLVKAWEVPTMEFIDILEELTHHNNVTLYPLGYAHDGYKAKSEESAIWEQKIATQNLQNVSIKR
jgi:hypothetical protein